VPARLRPLPDQLVFFGWARGHVYSTPYLNLATYKCQSVGTYKQDQAGCACFAYIFFAYKRNEAKLELFLMCFACSIEKFSYIFSLRFKEVIFASMRNKRNHALFSLPCETKYLVRFQFSLPKRKRGRTLDQGYVSVSVLVLVDRIWILLGNVIPCLRPMLTYHTVQDYFEEKFTQRCLDFLLCYPGVT
jgi:hypothetical protein